MRQNDEQAHALQQTPLDGASRRHRYHQSHERVQHCSQPGTPLRAADPAGPQSAARGAGPGGGRTTPGGGILCARARRRMPQARGATPGGSAPLFCHTPADRAPVPPATAAAAASALSFRDLRAQSTSDSEACANTRIRTRTARTIRSGRRPSAHTRTRRRGSGREAPASPPPPRSPPYPAHLSPVELVSCRGYIAPFARGADT